MASHDEPLAPRYHDLSDPELIRIARSYDDLTDAAQHALRQEFSRRGLEPPLVDDGVEVDRSARLVTIRRYRDLSEALVARSMLEGAGLQAFLCDENIVRLEWQISNFIGGIRLQVEALDREAASELLDHPLEETIRLSEDEVFN